VYMVDRPFEALDGHTCVRVALRGGGGNRVAQRGEVGVGADAAIVRRDGGDVKPQARDPVPCEHDEGHGECEQDVCSYRTPSRTRSRHAVGAMRAHSAPPLRRWLLTRTRLSTQVQWRISSASKAGRSKVGRARTRGVHRAQLVSYVYGGAELLHTARAILFARRPSVCGGSVRAGRVCVCGKASRVWVA
jgi:hypothetical protein